MSISPAWLTYPWCRQARRLGDLGQANQRAFGEINRRERFFAPRDSFLFFLILLVSFLPRFDLPGILYARESSGRVKATRVSRQTDLLWLVSAWYFVFQQQTATTSQLRILDTYIKHLGIRCQNRGRCKKTRILLFTYSLFTSKN